MAIYDLTPVDVPKVETKYRSIRTKLPVPESLPIFAALQESEPPSMMGQPPVVWDKAEDFIAATLQSPEGLLMTPRRTGTDGFFVSVLKRQAAS